MGEPLQAIPGATPPAPTTKAEQAIAAVVIIWVGALLALLPAMVTSSGPTIAACLISFAAAPPVLLVLLGATRVLHRSGDPATARGSS
ncbi:MAG TPA: hypothetical protein VHX15_20350 [Frankiaceae bacterium]|nr:hypothetical protein [Frankiaceae bacterium]